MQGMTCFLFAQTMDHEHCLSLRLDALGEVDAPLEIRTSDEFKALQAAARTIVVLPAEMSTLHHVELSLLSEQKARAAIPYALEENIAQSVTTMHFAFDRQHYQQGRYLVVVLDKQYITDLIQRLERLTLSFDSITLDWFALNVGEVCVGETSLLVHDDEFKGALSLELATLYFDRLPTTSSVLVYADSAPLSHLQTFRPMACSIYVWVAQRLLKARALNLCQGELQRDTGQYAARRWYQVSALLAGLLCGSFFLIKGLLLYVLSSKIGVLDQKIAVVYREFFPQATQIINPRFRLSQLMKSDHTSENMALWRLLDKLATVFQGDKFTIIRLHFQNKTLSVTLSCRDFSILEKVEQRLEQAQVKVKQLEAATHDDRIVAVLELT